MVKKNTKECLVIDIAVTGDLRVEEKEDGKCEKYSVGQAMGAEAYSDPSSCWGSEHLTKATSASLWKPIEIRDIRVSNNIEESFRDCVPRL